MFLGDDFIVEDMKGRAIHPQRSSHGELRSSATERWSYYDPKAAPTG